MTTDSLVLALALVPSLTLLILHIRQTKHALKHLDQSHWDYSKILADGSAQIRSDLLQARADIMLLERQNIQPGKKSWIRYLGTERSTGITYAFRNHPDIIPNIRLSQTSGSAPEAVTWWREYINIRPVTPLEPAKKDNA